MKIFERSMTYIDFLKWKHTLIDTKELTSQKINHTGNSSEVPFYKVLVLADG